MKRLLTVSLLALAWCVSSGGTCQQQTPSGPTPSSPPTTAPTAATAAADALAAAVAAALADDLPPGFVFFLREADPQSAATAATRPPAAPLDTAATTSLLARLPPLPPAPADNVVPFALRPGSPPPPLSGATISAPFPPPPTPDLPPPADNNPLTVLRFQPEGLVPLAPRVTITFSHPMVPLTSHAALADDALPVRMTPAIDGRWRWVGGRTLVFDPVGRAPMATDFTVEVPPGLRDANGRTLERGARWTFRTPPPSIVAHTVADTHNLTSIERTPTIVITFDQRVDPARTLNHLRVEAAGSVWKTRLLDAEELAAVAKTMRNSNDTDNAMAGRWVAFRVVDRLPPDTTVKVVVPRGLPSAEGPGTTTEAQSFVLKTYGDMRMTRAECLRRDHCQPRDPLRITFSNTIDEGTFDPALVTVEPALPGLRIEAIHNNISLSGLAKSGVTYTVKVSTALTDTFGQALAQEVSIPWRIRPAEPSLGMNVRNMQVLDPSARRSVLPAYAMNMPEVHVKLFKVSPDDWPAWLAWQSGDRKNSPPGTKVIDTRMPTGAAPDELTEFAIDLAPALDAGLGHVIAHIESVGAAAGRRSEYTYWTWLQVTRLGVDAFADHGQLHAWVTDLATGAPLGDVAVALTPGGNAVPTDDRGLVRMDLPEPAGRRILVARRGRDTAFLPDSLSTWDGVRTWTRKRHTNQLRWFTFDDRGLYRPGESVHVKGAVRVFDHGQRGDIAALPAGTLTSIDYTVVDARRNEIAKGSAPLSMNGSFHFDFRLPPTPNLGHARILIDSGLRDIHAPSVTHGFQIQEFRRPEFEAAATASDGPHFVGQSAIATLTAGYFAGGPLRDTATHWAVRANPGHFRPPNHDDFAFGAWTAWWNPRHFDHNPFPAGATTRFEGRTDAHGRHQLALDFRSVSPPRPVVVEATANIADVNRQTWSSATTFLVHPAAIYAGLKAKRTFAEAGRPVEIDVVAVDVSGKRSDQTPVAVTMTRIAWERVKGQYAEVEYDHTTCNVTPGQAPARCVFAPKAGGRHRIVATLRDPAGRRNETRLTVWVAGEKSRENNRLDREAITIIPAAKDVEVGSIAEFLIQTPFSPAEGVYLIRRGGIAAEHRFSAPDGTAIIKIPVETWMIPGFTLSLHVNGSAPRTDIHGVENDKLARRPAFASGNIAITVPPTSRRLTVTVTPAATRIAPGASTDIDVVVRDAAGKPVKGAEVALIAVDEAILALTGHRLRNPLDVFHVLHPDTTSISDFRNYVLLSTDPGGPPLRDETRGGISFDFNDVLISGDGAGGMGLSGEGVGRGGGSAPRAASPKLAAAPAPPARNTNTPIAVRSDFEPLILFAPETTTDAEGRIRIPVRTRDSLTRYRVMALAFAGEKFMGTGEAAITARLPLMVRLSAPRFLNFGDRFELPVVIQNQSDESLDVQVAVRTTNATLTAGSGRSVRVPPNDRVEVLFPAAADMAGKATFQAGVTAGPWSDATEVSLPVWTPTTTEAFAIHGELDAGSLRQPVRIPPDAIPTIGGLEIQTSATQLQALTDAVLYLVDYPFECAEQAASRVLAIAALKDILGAFGAAGLPSPEALKARIDADIARLATLQGGDGGFAFWRRDERSWPFVTVHVAHALVRARDKGFTVPATMLDSAIKYLRNIRTRLDNEDYSLEVKRSIESYALYVRHRAGDSDPARARAIIKAAQGLANVPLDVVGWLYPIFSGAKGFAADVAAIRKHLNNRVTETAATANFVSDYTDGAWLTLHSNRRLDGLLLEGLILDQPKSDLIPKIVRGLLAHRSRGHWGSTQENAWVLLGLDRYFHAFEADPPDFTARIWLGDRFASEHRFAGRTTDRHDLRIPMQALLDAGPTPDLTLSHEGKGRMHYRLALRHAPKSLDIKPSGHGFFVSRTYAPVDAPDDVTRDADGRWIIKAGARVRVELTLHTDSRRYHVALVDPLPAGFEPLNPALRGTDRTAPPPTLTPSNGPAPWWRRWYDHENLRDERVEVFASLLREGVHTYAFIARATTPGEFIAPPPRAEEMYAPETFGRGATERVIVK